MGASGIECSLVLVKPDGIRRGLVGEVLRRIETKGDSLVALDLRVPTADIARWSSTYGAAKVQQAAAFVRTPLGIA